MFSATSVQTLVEGVVAADAAGIDEVWIADEGVMRDPAVALSGAADNTRRIRLGIGITSPLLALPRDAPATSLAVLRLGDGGSSVVPAHAAPARELPIHVASRGPKINALASAAADGVFVSGCMPAQADADDPVGAVARYRLPLFVAVPLDHRVDGVRVAVLDPQLLADEARLSLEEPAPGPLLDVHPIRPYGRREVERQELDDGHDDILPSCGAGVPGCSSTP